MLIGHNLNAETTSAVATAASAKSASAGRCDVPNDR